MQVSFCTWIRWSGSGSYWRAMAMFHTIDGMKKLSFKRLLSRKKRLIIAATGIVLLVLATVVSLRLFKNREVPTIPPTPAYSQLTGTRVASDIAERPILGVMIENHPAARPQTGLDAAGIVFETVTEGGITRYLALYQENLPEELGPIRSVRSQYVNWVMGFDASITHVGGSADALELLSSRGAKSLSQFTYPEPYHRVGSREAPHNMYVSTKALQELQRKLGHKTAQFEEIPRTADTPSPSPEAGKVTINFSGADYLAEFHYQKDRNVYTRYLAGSPDIDAATNKPVTVKNLVVITMPSNTIQAIGSGSALVFKDGNVQTVTWKQSSYKTRIILTDAQGNQVGLNRGDTWFAVLPSSGSVDYTAR